MKLIKGIKRKLQNKMPSDFRSAAQEIEIDEIKFLSRFQSMFHLNSNELSRITDSMIKNGYDKSHPVHLWRKDGGFYLVDGHTRLAAVKQAGLTSIWAVLHDFKTEDEAYRYALEQQLNRRNLNEAEMLDVLEKYDKLNSSKVTNENLAHQLGISPRQVTKMRTVLHEATDDEKEKIRNGESTVNQTYNRIRATENVGKGKQETTKCKFCDTNGMCNKHKEITQ